MPLTLPSPDRHSVTAHAPVPDETVEVLVVGAGAAGCAAATALAEGGAQVLLVDEHPVPPGLVGLDVPYHFGGRATAAVQNPDRLVETLLATNPGLEAAVEAGVDVRLGTAAWMGLAPGPGLASVAQTIVALADAEGSRHVAASRLVVATGARDLTLSFAGSDQPGVMGAQGFAALLTRYEAFAGRRIAILGSGPLAVATAELALSRGIEVAALVEVRDAPEAAAPAGVEVWTGHVPLAAEGGADGVTALLLTTADGRQRRLSCDTVVLALGTVPVIDLLDTLGAARAFDGRRGGHVPVLEGGATSVPGVWAAGDCAGLGGEAAGAGQAVAAAVLASLGRGTPSPDAVADVLGPDIASYGLDWTRAMLATGGTEVLACLCEEVTRGEVLGVQPPRYLEWRSNQMARRDISTLAADGPLNQDQIKRLTRACMGACQARRCREQVAHLLAIGGGTGPEAIPLAGYRAPLRPLPLSVLAAEETPEMGRDWNVWFGIDTQWIPYDDIGTEREAEEIRAGMPY
jgi:thioredoxin reductase